MTNDEEHDCLSPLSMRTPYNPTSTWYNFCLESEYPQFYRPFIWLGETPNVDFVAALIIKLHCGTSTQFSEMLMRDMTTGRDEIEISLREMSRRRWLCLCTKLYTLPWIVQFKPALYGGFSGAQIGN